MNKETLAELLSIPEDFLTLNNGLWNVNFDSQIYYNNNFKSVTINKNLVKDGKLIVKFGTVNGSFYCSGLNLVSLEGCPHTVNGSFDCSDNKLLSLKYCPKRIIGDFYCGNNELTSLQYCPKSIIGSFWCYRNKITSFQNIKADNYISHHNNITHISDDIDMTKICIYKNPYHYFKKFNYGIN